MGGVIFVGIDPGLTAPAICVMDESGHVKGLRTIRTGNLRGMERVDSIWRGVWRAVMGNEPCLVSIEDYAYSRNAQGQRGSIEAVGILKWELHHFKTPVMQSVGPMQLKKYVTGNGQATKRAMIDAAAAAGVSVIDDNQADAWGLATILRDAYLLTTEGVQPATLYRYEVCDGLRPWIQEQIDKLKGA